MTSFSRTTGVRSGPAGARPTKTGDRRARLALTIRVGALIAPTSLGFTVLSLMLLGAPRAALGQEVVRGTVREAGTAAPIEGAMIVLTARDRVHARTLSAADGSFRLLVRHPGRYRIRVDRIGYESNLSDELEVVLGQPYEIDLRVPVRAVTLRGLDVTGGTRCRTGPRQDGSTAVVWEEARKALEAARWTSERRLYRFAWVRYVRELDDDGERILAEDRTSRRAFTPNPFRSIDAGTLAREGFVREDGDETLYAAPDAEVLLSPRFLEGHCFALDVRELEDRSILGLRFQPVPDRSVPDVEGVVWLDRRTGRMESVEYEYVNLPRAAVVRGDDASGRLLFRELPNGTWIVEEWSIRMPKLVEVRDEEGRTRRYDVRGYVEEGGEVVEISTAGGLVLDGGSGTGIHGIVADSLGRPAAGARVWIAGTDHEARTDSAGTFRLDEVGAGVWSIRATHAALSRYGHAGAVAEVRVEREGIREVRLSLPSVAAVALDRCAGSTSAEADSVTLLGRVVGRDGTPVPDAAVRVVWTEARGAFHRSFEGFGTDADSLGVFTVCAIPRGRTVIASASVDDGRVEGPALSLEDVPGVVAVDLRPAPRSGEPDGSRRPDAPDGSRPPDAPDASVRPDEPAPSVREDAAGGRGAGGEAAWLDSLAFYDRRSYALVHRTNRQILDLGYDSLPQLLADVPRLEVRPLPTGETQFWLHPTADWTPRREAEGSCEVEFYLNGSRVQQRIGQNWEISLHRIIEPIFVTGLEIHDAETAPVGDPEACGVVLLWLTKLREKDDPSFTGTVQGRVRGLGEGISADDVRLRLEPRGLVVGVDESGSFDFGEVPPGRYTIEAVVPGWGTWSSRVDVRMHATVEVVIEVETDPVSAYPPTRSNGMS